MTQNHQVTDRIGQNIEVGSIIAYGHALGRCAGIQLGKVLRIEHEYHTPTYRDEKYIDNKWQKVEPYIVRPEYWTYSILVWGVDEDWNWDGRGPKLRRTKGTLQFPDRMIVIAPDKVPTDIAALLAPITVDSTPKSLGLK